MADKKISELDAVLQINNDAVFPISQDNAGEPTTFKAGITQLGAEIVEDMTFSNLQTTSKKIVGAINEIAQSGGGVSDLTNTASGSIATFTDGGDNIPVKAFECEIVAQQAEGTPTPASPLSITGFSQADISVCGKNLIDQNKTYQLNANIVVVGQNVSNAERKVFLPKGTYTIKVEASTSATIYYDFGTGSVSLGNTSEARTFTLADNAYCAFWLYKSGGYTPSDFTSIQLETGSTATDYKPYKGNTYIVEFGQTIYGGRLVYANGEWAIEATHGFNVYDGSEDWIFQVSSGVNTFRLLKPNDSASGINNKSNILPSASSQSVVNNTFYFGNTNMVFSTNDISSLSDWQTLLANNSLQVVYELATPVIIPITSTTRVKTISGDNNIFSNTGDVSLEYFTNKADSLAELIKAMTV